MVEVRRAFGSDGKSDSQGACSRQDEHASRNDIRFVMLVDGVRFCAPCFARAVEAGTFSVSSDFEPAEAFEVSW